jgi:hypothetical protein
MTESGGKHQKERSGKPNWKGYKRRFRVAVGRGVRKPVTFWLPGVFLFLLGLGNTVVGVMKAEQFDQVLRELVFAKQYKEEVSSSPLMRMQLARKLTDKLFDEYSTYQERKRFYQTVAFGGKVVMSLSLVLFIGACFCATSVNSNLAKSDEVKG